MRSRSLAAGLLSHDAALGMVAGLAGSFTLRELSAMRRHFS